MTNRPSKRKSFIIHKDSLSVLKKLNDVQAGKLFKSIAAYQEHNLLPEDNLISIVFEPFLNQFIRDEENYRNTCERRREAGSKGGKQKVANASKSKQKVANLADSKSDSKSDSDSDSKNKSDNKNILKEQFESFWIIYNKKVSRADAEVKFKRALKKDSFENIMSGLDKYVKSRGEDSKYWKHPSTWLNKECWNDEYKTGDQNSSKSNTNQRTVDFINKMIKGTLINRIVISSPNKAQIWFNDSDSFKKYQDLDIGIRNQVKDKITEELNITNFEPKF